MKKGIFLLHILLSFFIYGSDSMSPIEISYFKKYNTKLSYLQQSNSEIKDSIRTRVLAEEKLRLIKSSNDISELADAYYELALLSKRKEAILYADSIIALSQDTEDFNYPAKAYLLKARLYGSQSKYQQSMDELIKANRYANLYKNVDQQYEIKYSIAVLQGSLGNHKEALSLLESVTEYYNEKNENNKEQYQRFYIKSLFALGDSYNSNTDYDNAYLTNKKAIILSLKTKDSVLYPYLLLNSGITHFHKKEYNFSIDSILKLKNIITEQRRNKSNWVVSDLILGKNYFEQGNIELALKYFNIVDSTAFTKNSFEPSILSMYEMLIKHYKDQQAIEKQLFYINKLLIVDSILDKDFKYLYEQIDKKYYTPNLIQEKQVIIDSLKKDKKNTIFIVAVLAILSILLILFLFKNIQKKKTYYRRFTELLEKTKDRKTPVEVSVTEKTTPALTKQLSDRDDIGISQIIINDILKNLRIFEENKGFTASNITVSILAKQFKTNSKYLSKVINIYKEKSFSNYINDLRIDYIVEKLKTDTVFRRYTIKAIAMEVGFNTSEAFSKSFFKSTGIYPSFFLKQLEKVTK